MLGLESLRRIDPVNTLNLTDTELEEIRLSFYELGQIIFEEWQENESVSKSPLGSLTVQEEQATL